MTNSNNYYNSIAKGYNELYGKEQLEKFEIIKDYIHGKVLDVGCGTGIITSKIPDSIGIDSSIELLKQSKKNRLLANAENLPFKNKVFDTVISLTVIQDTKNPQRVVNECERVGKNIIITCLKRKKSKKWFSSLFKNIKGKVIEQEKDWIFISKDLIKKNS